MVPTRRKVGGIVVLCERKLKLRHMRKSGSSPLLRIFKNMEIQIKWDFVEIYVPVEGVTKKVLGRDLG